MIEPLDPAESRMSLALGRVLADLLGQPVDPAQSMNDLQYKYMTDAAFHAVTYLAAQLMIQLEDLKAAHGEAEESALDPVAECWESAIRGPHSPHRWNNPSGSFYRCLGHPQ